MRIKEFKRVSVIIPTHGNREAEKVEENVNLSTYKNIEVIVVNEGLERSAQRNIGVRRATGDYLLFLDSDMRVHPLLIAECVGLMELYDGLYIPEVLPESRIKTFIRSFYNETPVDAIRFIKRSYWTPFDERLTGVEDWDWDRRFKGTKGITHYPLYHYPTSHLARKLYYAKWLKEYKRRYPECKALSLRYRLFTVFIEKGKWKKWIKLLKFSR